MVKLVLEDWHERIQDTLFYARATCRSLGYALAVHGSLRRDVDVVAVPWTEKAAPISQAMLATAVYDTLLRMDLAIGWGAPGEVGEAKPNGRHAWCIVLKGEPFLYLDLSVLPWSSG